MMYIVTHFMLETVKKENILLTISVLISESLHSWFVFLHFPAMVLQLSI